MAEENQIPTAPDSIHFHYVKSTHFRVCHYDGAIGGPTPRGFIQIGVFSERQPIPRETEVEVNSHGLMISGEKVVDSRSGVIREVEVELIMTLQSAKELRDWLSAQVSQLEEFISGGKELSGHV